MGILQTITSVKTYYPQEIRIKDDYYCNDEEYLQDEYYCFGHSVVHNTSGTNPYLHCAYNDIRRGNVDNNINGGRIALYILNNSSNFGIACVNTDSSHHNEINLKGGSKSSSSPEIPDNLTYSWLDRYNRYPHSYWDYSSGSREYGWFEFTTNIPIFEEQTDAVTYVTEGTGLSNAINYKPAEESPDGDLFEITNCWAYGIWINDTQPQVTQIYYRNFRAKMTGGSFALYPISGIDDNKLKMGIKNNATFYEMEYSTDGLTWTPTDTFPFDFFYRKRINELSPNINTYIGYALTFSNSKIPVFSNETKATGYINGTVDITEADNWSDISSEYPVLNGTGADDPSSDFGEVKTRGFFSQQYIMDSTCLQALANDLFDTSIGGIWEAIKKGLDMYGDNPIEAVMGLSFWPVDLTQIFTGSPASYVWFGGYGWVPQSGTAQKLVYPNGYKSIGTVTIKRTFNSWRDMEPYSKLYVMLPYCGIYQLDLARYYDKEVEVRYYFDTRTNGCIACLIADGFLIDYFNGQMGVTMPITLTDYTAYMNAQINTLLGGGGQAAQSFGDAAGIVGGASAAGGAALAGAAVGGALEVGISGAAVGAKMVYGLSQNNINNFNKTKGGSSSMINEYLPQSVCFIFEIQEDCAPENYGEMFGYPSMKAGKIFNFSGFLKCQAVKLSCGIATERERERLKQMLLSGIYI